jgi:hypothetical protein
VTRRVQVTEEQVAAAKLRVTIDRRLGRTTAPLIAEVAKARSAAEFNAKNGGSGGGKAAR